jgi:hypothetical protein
MTRRLRLTNNVNPKIISCYLMNSFNDLIDPSVVLDAFQKPLTIMERIASFHGCQLVIFADKSYMKVVDILCI